jgi:hypothetical protein
MATIRLFYSCSPDIMNRFLSLFSEDWVATGAPTKGSYQTVPFLIEET